jgi:hypothetical protein
MSLQINVDTVGFKKLCDDLAKMSGKSFEDVVKTQAGSVLKRVMGKTKAADRAKLNARARQVANMEKGFFPLRDGTAIIIGTRTGKKFWKDYATKTGKPTIYPIIPERRWSDARWARYTAANNRIALKLKEWSKKILGARGFSKQTWLNIAKEFGVEYILKAPAYVQKAKSTSKKIYRNTEGTEHFTMRDAYVVMKQRYKNLTENGFASVILQAAIKARVKAFMKDVDAKVFEDAKKRATRYPGVFVKPPK